MTKMYDLSLIALASFPSRGTGLEGKADLGVMSVDLLLRSEGNA